MQRVLIATAIQNRAWVLPYYLRYIYNIEYDKKLIDIYWIINNSTDKSYELLSEFQNKYLSEYNSIKIEVYNNSKIPNDERTSKIRENYTYQWLSQLRNKILKKCVEINADYLFSCDCDILVKSDILKRLLSHNKSIVASLIYNGYKYVGLEKAYQYTNILKDLGNRNYQHIVNYRTKFPEKNEKGTLVSCDFTGACVLMSQNVCEKTEYSYHKQGEDEPWSWSARQAGFEMFCDVSMYSQHIMGFEFLDVFKDF